MAKFILPYNIPLTPSHYVTAPWGALGSVLPRPLASLRSEGFVYIGIFIYQNQRILCSFAI